MAGLFSNIFTKDPGSVIGVDIGSSAIKIVELYRKGGKAILKTYGEIALGPYGGQHTGQSVKLTVEQVATALKDVLKEADMKTRSAGVAVPMKSSMVTIFSLPPVDEKQLNTMVPIEARKYIPVPIGEVALDWSIIPSIDETNEGNEPQEEIEKRNRDILLVAIHNSVLSTLSAILNQAEVSASFYEIEMFATLRALIDPNETRPVMIFDMGAGATKVYIVERGIIRESHNISKGSQDITVRISQSMTVDVDYAEKLKRSYGRNSVEHDQKIREIIDLALEPIFSEAQRVLLNFQRKYSRTVATVILTGGGVALQGMDVWATKYFETSVVLGDPFTKVEAPAFLAGVLKTAGLEFATAVGLALRKLQEQA